MEFKVKWDKLPELREPTSEAMFFNIIEKTLHKYPCSELKETYEKTQIRQLYTRLNKLSYQVEKEDVLYRHIIYFISNTLSMPITKKLLNTIEIEQQISNHYPMMYEYVREHHGKMSQDNLKEVIEYMIWCDSNISTEIRWSC